MRLKDAQKRGDAISQRGETEACLAEPVSMAPEASMRRGVIGTL